MASGIFTLKQQLQGLIQGAWSGPQKTNYVEYLVVAGGGGADAGGGGAGGLLQGLTPVTTGSSITVTVGGGGSGGYPAADGQNSVFGAISARGGGRGSMAVNGYQPDVSGGAYSGGSGGGAYQTSVPGFGTPGQGNSGGNNGYGSPSSTAGGGGGAGTIGLNTVVLYTGANGGAGISSAISGTVTAYAGGGAGGGYQSVGVGGVGGGGNAGFAGTANTGGGGGGYRQCPGNLSGAAGGSGIVIISYPDTYSAPASFGGANSPTASTSGSGSLSFNGSSQWLSYGSASNWSFLNNGSTFTVEAWVYPTATLTGTNTLIATGYNSASIGLNIWFGNATNNDVYVVFYNSGTYSSFYTSTNAITINAWNHIAVTYNSSGTTAAIYVNGVSQSLTFGGTSLSSFTFSSSAPSYPLKVASTQNGAYYFPGYMSNVRITNTLVYSSNFTPSTTPLKPVSGTQFLLSTVSPNGYLDSSTNGYIYTLTGTPSWNQLSPFATGLGYKNRVYTWTGSGSIIF